MLKRGEVGFTDDGDPGEPTTGLPRVSVSEMEASILSALGAGRNVLEIGTGLGVSTRAFLRYATSVYTHDIDPWVHETIWPGLRDEGAFTLPDRSRWHYMNGFFDLIFIDGAHDTLQVVEDIARAQSLGWALHRPLIVCHDARYPNVERAIPKDWHRVWTEHGLAIGR